MAREIEEKVLQIRLTDFQAVQAGYMGRQCLQARVNVVGANLDNALRFQYAVIDALKVTADIFQRQFDNHILIPLPQQLGRAAPDDYFSKIHDCDFIAKYLCFIHVVRGQNDSRTV